MGAAYGTSKAGVGILVSGISSPDLVWRNLIPIIMAGVNGIYGLITAIVVMSAIISPADDATPKYSLFTGYAHLAAGLCCGLCGLGSGIAIGVAGEASVKSCGYFDYESKKVTAFRGMLGGGAGGGGFQGGYGGGNNNRKKQKSKGGGDNLFVAMVLIQVFAGNLALYGLITSIILSQMNYVCDEYQWRAQFIKKNKNAARKRIVLSCLL